MGTAESEQVDHPSHYTQGSIECIEAIKAALTPQEFLGYCKGNVIKYTWRLGHKSDLDAEKTEWYAKEMVPAYQRTKPELLPTLLDARGSLPASSFKGGVE